MLLQHASQRARRVISLALLALLVSQFGALVHAVVHAPLLVGNQAQVQWAASSQAPVHAPAEGAAHTHAATGDGAATDEHRAGSPVCQVVDHLLFGQAPGGPDVQVLAMVWATSAPQHGSAPITPARPTQAYEARGPPRA